MKTQSILITGVGGQGTLLASRILGAFANVLNCDVKLSEVHGMAQRGGSVVTYVRLGEKVASPLIEVGGADFLLAFEQMEAVRYLPMVRKGGTVVVNTQKILPMPVVTGKAAYPDDLLQKIEEAGLKLVAVDALTLAQEAGNAKATNTALIGALAREMNMAKEQALEALRFTVPPKTVAVNEKAFLLGYGQTTER